MSLSDFKLTLRLDGVAELERNGAQVWSSDSDEDLLDEVGKSGLTLRPRDMGNVLDYLVSVGEMTDQQADDCIVYTPEGWDDLFEDEEEDEDDEDDEVGEFEEDEDDEELDE